MASVVVYLHGFGTTAPRECPVFLSLEAALAIEQRDGELQLLAPCYHPGGRVDATSLVDSLDELTKRVLRERAGLAAGSIGIVGYSVGGLLASLLASTRPDLVDWVVLLAPAVDNIVRNYQGVPEAEWPMAPGTYVEELCSLPARPSIDTGKVPTVIFHGTNDTDRGGSMPWRIREWAAVRGGIVVIGEKAGSVEVGGVLVRLGCVAVPCPAIGSSRPTNGVVPPLSRAHPYLCAASTHAALSLGALARARGGVGRPTQE